ncbi:hypothetical protein JR316_0011891 [Psilocybe cubensis]|uniref:Uncharacterized protein n=2 Tax=Psilocybe cubensis TaxID=181762 RepID=A0ACB8GKW2_PSICU|nr:hypothetical protein JR316_0011891 [Psilocybe cubensis]KAH9476316.1 hypothetical protein JR316_0011891 [Psilocybe cubensis]
MASTSSFTKPSQIKKGSTPKAPQTPSIHIATDLPCPADKDTGPMPRPSYSVSDICRVQNILLHFVPVELADVIIDLAEYWPWVAVSRNSFNSAYSALEAPDNNAQWCFLVTPKVPSIERAGVSVPTMVKMVKFFIKSYESCYEKTKESRAASDVTSSYTTWFESMILRHGESIPTYESPIRPNNWFSGLAAPHPKYLNDFQECELAGAPIANPMDDQKRWHVATSSPSANPGSTGDNSQGWHEVTWKYNDPVPTEAVIESSNPTARASTGAGFVNSLSVGDQIVLMARALSPGWINTVFNVKVEVYYAFSSSYF